MIPKIIHYTWFSGEPFPEKIQMCIDTWHKHMPEYKLVCWDAERLKEIDSVWVTEALAERKWAVAADYVRLYAVYKYGGIYLDTDCYIYQSFNSLLNNKSFIGKESSIHVDGGFMEVHLSSHCFGAEAGDYFVGRCLSFYDNRHFNLSDDTTMPYQLRHGVTMLPYIQSEFAKQHGYNPYPSADYEQHLDCGVTIYPSSYFDITKVTANSYCRHLAAGSWREAKPDDAKITLGYKIKWRIEAVFKWIANSCGYVLIKKM